VGGWVEIEVDWLMDEMDAKWTTMCCFDVVLYWFDNGRSNFLNSLKEMRGRILLYKDTRTIVFLSFRLHTLLRFGLGLIFVQRKKKLAVGRRTSRGHKSDGVGLRSEDR